MQFLRSLKKLFPNDVEDLLIFFADTHIFRKTANITRGSYRKGLAIHTVNIGLELSRSHKEFD